jgi:hypothetical protein
MFNAAPDRLRAHFARHNRRVLIFALITAAAAVTAWALLYFIMYWLVLLMLTVNRPLETEMPVFFPHAFIGIALALCFWAWLLRRVSPDESPRDKKFIWEIVLDVILMVPRITLSIWGTLRAYQSLDKRERGLALNLLQRIERDEPLPVYAVPQEIPDERARIKILLALQITELVNLRKRDEDFVLALRDENARALCHPLVRIRTR